MKDLNLNYSELIMIINTLNIFLDSNGLVISHVEIKEYKELQEKIQNQIMNTNHINKGEVND